MDTEKYRFVVSEDQAGERLDVFLSALFPESSRSRQKKLIEDGAVRVERGETDAKAKPSFLLREGDAVEVAMPENRALEIEAEDIPLDIIYEDYDLLVVNKPKGMVVHPAPGHMSGTLVNAVMFHCGDSLSGINGVLRPGIVHRIDRDTTGSVIVCKNDNAHRGIAQQLADHSLTRIYHALVLGRLPEEEGVIDRPVARSASDRKKMAVVAEGQGKNAVTHYRLEKYFPGDDVSYVTCRLETGRTHQIRVHMASFGHPVLGDQVYGKPKSRFKLEGQCLHAKTLNFVHPVTGKLIETDAPLPQYFSHLLEVLK